MKVNIKRAKPPELWIWMKRNPIQGLVPHDVTDGYSTTYAVTMKEAGWFKPVIARVWDATVDLNYPEWMSDFEMKLQQYERETGVECTLNVHESLKDGKK